MNAKDETQMIKRADALNESTKVLYIFYYLFYSFLASKVKENIKLLIVTRLEMKNEFIAERKNKSVWRG